MRPTYNEINLAHLRHNLKQIKSVIPSGGTLLSIVKANAYGHGAPEICRELEKCGENYFGVATVGEALVLREHNINSNILILGSFYDTDIDDILWHNFIPVCYRKDHLNKLNDCANSAQTKIRVHIKFDTGMGRLGFEWKDAEEIVDLLLSRKNLVVEGLMSHLASAEEETDYNALQIKRFEEIKKTFTAKGLTPSFFHIANSSAILKKLRSPCNLFRPGIALYGAYTTPSLKKILSLKQLMTLRSEITQIKELEPGRSVSYGRTFTTSRKSTVAVIPIGYADGYNRKLSNRGKVIIRGQFADVIGAVCMDMIIADITGIINVKTGDRVTLLGYDSGKFISLNEISTVTDSLPYEIMCGISERVIKRYLDESPVMHCVANKI